MGVFISILSKILLCLTLQAWLLAASGSSISAGEAGAVSESLTFPVKVASQDLREGRNPASSIHYSAFLWHCDVTGGWASSKRMHMVICGPPPGFSSALAA